MITGSIIKRILLQLVRDRRTLGLIILMPIIIMTLFYFLFNTAGSQIITLGVQQPDDESGLLELMIQNLKEDTDAIVVVVDGPDIRTAALSEDVDALLIFPEGFSPGPAGPVQIEIAVDPAISGIMQKIPPILERALLKTILSVNPFFSGIISGTDRLFEPKVTYLYGNRDYRFLDLVSPPFIAFFLFFISFLLTCVSFLRERSQGTLERLLISPSGAARVVTGYLVAFFILSTVQSALLLAFSIGVLGIKSAVSPLYAMVPMLMTVLTGVTMGIFASALATTEFQVIQFIPIVIIPQGLLSGIILDISMIPKPLNYLSYCFPLTYTNRILKEILLRGTVLADVGLDILILTGFFLLFYGLSLLSIRRSHQ